MFNFCIVDVVLILQETWLTVYLSIEISIDNLFSLSLFKINVHHLLTYFFFLIKGWVSGWFLLLRIFMSPTSKKYVLGLAFSLPQQSDPILEVLKCILPQIGGVLQSKDLIFFSLAKFYQFSVWTFIFFLVLAILSIWSLHNHLSFSMYPACFVFHDFHFFVL